MQKIIKREQAITLIALVVTIIILLILAGITISQLTGNGLFEKAKEARKKYEIARQDEEKELNEYESQISNSNRKEQSTRQVLSSSPIEILASTSWANRDADITLNDSIKNYDYLVFNLAIDSGTNYVLELCKMFDTSTIEYQNSNVESGNIRHFILNDRSNAVQFQAYFKDNKTMHIWQSITTASDWNKIVIRSIAGIKF